MTRKTQFFVRILAVIVSLTSGIFAQTRKGTSSNPVSVKISVDFTIGSLNQLGFKNPYIEIGAGPEVENNQFRGFGRIGYSPTDKFVGEGSSYNLEAGAVYKTPIGIFGGGGVKWSHLDLLDQGSKSVARPRVEVGYGRIHKSGQTRISYRYIFATDKHNNLGGHEIKFTGDVHKFRFEPMYGHYNFNATENQVTKTCGILPCQKYAADIFMLKFGYLF